MNMAMMVDLLEKNVTRENISASLVRLVTRYLWWRQLKESRIKNKSRDNDKLIILKGKLTI